MFHAKENIVDLFRKVIFPYEGNVFKTKEEESEKKKLEKLKDDYNKFFKYIEDESMGINYIICLKIIFVFQYLGHWQKNYIK